ncbi:MAG: OmpA family protein [Planctomycetes bacterium]|nr:OmpA family protein [Planctomycetota bacterium]
MTKHRFLVLGMCAIASLAMGGCGKNRDLAYAKVHISELERQVADLEGQLAEKNAELERLRAGGVPQHQPSDVQRESIAGVDESYRDKEKVLSIASDVLFAPGKAVLTSKAKDTLDQVIRKLKAEYPGHDVRVEGHTDADPISRSKDLWEDNWDLAGGRARAVLHYLHDHGIAESSLGFAGYADQRPRDPGNKPRNRRVEIVAIPK